MSEPLSRQPHEAGFSGASEYQSLAPHPETPNRPLPIPRPPLRPRSFVDMANAMPTQPKSNNEQAQVEYGQRVVELTRTYESRHQQDLEGVSILGNLGSFLEDQEAMRDPTVPEEQKRQIVRQLTEFQFLLTHYAVNNMESPDFMKDFWQAAHTISSRNGRSKRFDSFKAGVLTAAATYKILDTLGKNPRLSHPSEDAFDAIDLWFGDTNAVQIKTGRENDVLIERTDTIEFPAAEVHGNGAIKVYSTETPKGPKDEAFTRFKMKVQRYSQRTGTPVEGYYLRVPYTQIDHNTGAPSAALINRIREKIGESDDTLAQAA